MKPLIAPIATTFILFISLACSSYVFSQDYSSFPENVRDKIDDNKVLGQDLYDGVQTTFIVYTEGLETSEFAELLARAEANTQILDVSFRDHGVVHVVCNSVINFDNVKPIFSVLVSNITNIESVYSLKNNN
jgi:hypothetical protein